MEKFREEYAPLVEREQLAQELLSLMQKTKMVTEITKMFMERALSCPKYVSLEQVKMSRYMSMRKDDIREFVSNNRYKTLTEMQEHAKRREIELETQTKEKR